MTFAGVKIKGILGRNELFMFSIIAWLMKFRSRLFLFWAFWFGISVFSSKAQQRIPQQQPPVNPVFQRIDEAFREGKLNLDQRIKYKVYAIKAPQKLPSDFRTSNNFPLKCGTPAIIDFHKHQKQLSASAVNEIESELHPPAIQSSKTYQSPSGKFTIHYETSGSDAVPGKDSNNNNIPDYVEEVAAAADSAYRYEVGTLGYPDPIPSGQTYDVEIRNLQKIYGQTMTYNGTTLIQIENDFSEGFPPNTDPEGNQIGDIKVTMAHEFKHAINYGINHWSGETTNWGEMDATLEEELVYDNVNDYYNYLRTRYSIFNNPQHSFYPGSYYQVTWAIFFEEKYGSRFWPDVWHIIGNNPDIRMVDAMSRELGGRQAFNRAYILSELWHYAAGDQHSVPGFGFEEKKNYPNSSVEKKFFGIDSLKKLAKMPNFSANYIELYPGIQNKDNINVNLTFSQNTSGLGLIAEFKDGSYDVISRVARGSLKPQIIKTPWHWANIRLVGIVATNSSDIDSTQYSIKTYPSMPQNITLYQNFPNPFNPETTIQFSLTQKTAVQLKVYDVTGRLVKTLRDGTFTPGYYQVPFNGSRLASGVYFYQLITNQKVFSKKMTLIK